MRPSEWVKENEFWGLLRQGEMEFDSFAGKAMYLCSLSGKLEYGWRKDDEWFGRYRAVWKNGDWRELVGIGNLKQHAIGRYYDNEAKIMYDGYF